MASSTSTPFSQSLSSWALSHHPGQRSLENRSACDAGIDVAKKLLVFEVVSFSFFLFSSLIAQGLKLAINLLNSKDVDEAFRAHINLKVLRFGMMGSAVGSVMGCIFLVLSMVNVIQIRLGMLSCGSKSAVHAVTALVLLEELQKISVMERLNTHKVLDTIDIHQKALDDLVNVNSLFTIAVFVGLSLAHPGEHSLEDRAECDPDRRLAKRLVVSEVLSFAFFLLSSLVAKTLKVHLNIYREKDFRKIKFKIIRGGMLLMSAWGSILGCVFLTASMVDVIQIRVGKISCGSVYAFRAAGSLIAIVLLALGIYVPFMMHAIYVSMKNIE
ncbi:hypothetical protein GH714_029068 [Hevea brasiliensis]|uniref:Uncharacterized protein n=1 Tax=Hevea brasiliensis TaxID=3981 RepID=A0A6A6K8G6_HEVBR|nr:hypothetical protein GH714_029068 [Hevea brasiliensis]